MQESGMKPNVAIVGATGAVGEALLEILESRQFPVGELFLLASERSAGKRVQFRGQSVLVQPSRHKLDCFRPEAVCPQSTPLRPPPLGVL